MTSEETTVSPTFEQLGQNAVLALDEIRPYWRNPRRISDEAVNAIAESIKRYGYQQPIVLDADHVIIIGHTRYTALRKLGYSEVPVVIASDLSPTQVKELRVVDNRAGEHSTWDFEVLQDELEVFDGGGLRGLFSDLLAAEEEAPEPGPAPDTDTAPEGGFVDDTGPSVELICPTCFHSWEQTVSHDELIDGRLRVVKES